MGDHQKEASSFQKALEMAIKQNKLHKMDDIYTRWVKWKTSQ